MSGFQLTMLDKQGQAGGRIALADRPIGIGRHPDNDIAINDDLASRFHCVIEPVQANGGGQTWKVRDLGSRNGTRVNNEKIADAALMPGDQIRVGGHVFVIEAPQQAEPANTRNATRAANATPAMAARNRQTETISRFDRDTAPASSAPVSGGRTPGLPKAPWADELVALVRALMPSFAGNEACSVIDARGKASEALSHESGGGGAMRLLFLAASQARATDIHVEPKGDSMNVRLRVDGQMLSVVDLPNQMGELCVGLVKAACHMKSAGRDAVLDGHFSAIVAGRRLDIRASLTPSVHGQKLVLRILNCADAPESLRDMGFPAYMYDRIKKSVEKDAGMIMVSGPTGSGKTTTLYNALREIDRERRNVITIEDPVEHHLDHVTQIPVNADQGATFGSLLRSVLRQDPDVILVGEIRDEETARVAMQAAMTGHLVFSTVHSKDTIGAVFRLLDLGVEPYLVANSMDLIIAQRLVRALCEHCKRGVRVTPGQATRMGRFLEGKHEVYAATGCARCLRTGFRGRHAIFEMLEFNEELRDIVLKEPSIQAMRKSIEQGLFTTLTQSGWRLVSQGLTTIDEVDRVAGLT